MDRPRHNDHLAVSKIGKRIKKTPLHLPNGNTSKNRLSSTVPLLKIRPAALSQRPHVPPPAMARPPMHPLPLMGHGNQFWSNVTAESPVSMYMPCLQSSLGDSGPLGNHMHPYHQYQPHSPPQVNGSSPDKPILPSQLTYNKGLASPSFYGDGLLPSPQSSFRDSGLNRNQMQPSHEYQPHSQPLLSNHHSPWFNASSASSVPILPSPRFNGRGILPTPPRTPRSFTTASMSQGGILGPGKFPHASTGLVFPPLPFGENEH